MTKTLLRAGAIALALLACMPASADFYTPNGTMASEKINGVDYPVMSTVLRGTATDRGASIGTSATQLMAANTARRGFAIQNQSASADCYISGSATATADFHSLKIPAGAYYETPPSHVGTGAISIVCTAASTSVYAREW